MHSIRLHGDNIVECERIVDLIISRLLPRKIVRGFASLACPFVEIESVIDKETQKIRFEMFPGFNKNTSDRWKTNILQLLKQSGSFLDETPDVILTKVVEKNEVILVAIEFCSALQAGNQAWQRSGRAYSIGRTTVPYIYIVDFVKYELNTANRKRKNLRFPNPAIPYSYISYSKLTGNIIIQAYFKAEEFQSDFDNKIKNFDHTIFSEKEVADFVIYKILGKNTTKVERVLLEKNLRMVKFLSTATKDKTNFTSKEWETQYSSGDNIIDYSKSVGRFNFSKKIAEKSKTGLIDEFSKIVKKYSKGFASSDLPFGIISKEDRLSFVKEIHSLYDIEDAQMIKDFTSEKDLVICMLKGFKPRGDDNRPDRGALPLIAMLAGENTEILTFIYGPIIKSNLKYIDNDLVKLARRNGLWKTFAGLSDYIIIDSPVIGDTSNVIRVINNKLVKQDHLKRIPAFDKLYIDNTPNQYQENDVDTVIHSLFKHILPQCFEGMCNPPGGDWSGMSIISENCEYRWLSLPRVSSDGKRPDHVLQLFDVLDTDWGEPFG